MAAAVYGRHPPVEVDMGGGEPLSSRGPGVEPQKLYMLCIINGTSGSY